MDYRCNIPEINQREQLSIVAGRHPFIDRDKVVPLTFEIGKKYNIPIFVGKTLSETGGTWIMDINDILEHKLVTGISVTKK